MRKELMSSMRKAILLASTWSLATGLQFTTQDPRDILQAGIQRLERMWPHVDGRQMFEEIFSTIPPHDEGGALQERLLQKYRDHGAFVFATFGSSVSAGHDNVMNQSWPFELERLLKPTFRDLGFDFELRQRAAGGYGEMPFAAGCLEARAGEGVDALSWEWFMFRDSPCEVHSFLAEAAAMKSNPMVFAFAGSSVLFENLNSPTSDDRCDQIRKSARRAGLRNHDEAAFDLPREWKPNEWYFTEEFISRKEADGVAKEYGDCGQKPNGASLRNVGRMTWLQQTGVSPPWEKAGHALYPVQVGAATKHVLQFPFYQAREKALNVNWHPGPLGHTLIASSIAHFFLTNLQNALSHERRESKGPSDDNPLVGKPILGKLVEPQCGRLRPMQCKTGMLPTTEGTMLSSARDPGSRDTWEFSTSRQAAERNTESVDHRMVYRGTKASGELKLNFQADRDGQYVILCGAPCGWWCEGNVGYVSMKSQRWWPDGEKKRRDVSDLTFSIDGRRVSSEYLNHLHEELFHQGNNKNCKNCYKPGLFCPGCKNSMDLCQPVAKVAKGKHTVGAKVEARSRYDVAPAGVPHMQEGEEMFVEILEMIVVG
jgi:hypothetical protein